MKNVPIDPKAAFGLRIKQLRSEKNITQEELADRCNMFRTYVSRIESGKANPSLTAIFDLAVGLEVSVTEVLAPPTTLYPQRVRALSPVSRGRLGN